MEIRHLKYFIAIADTGSFSEASRRCCLSQSAISQQIKSLEDELDVRLFERSPHRVVLTESGEMLLPMARKVVDDAERCRERMQDVKGLLCGELTIGLTYTLESYVRQAMAKFMRLYPNVKLNIRYKNIAELISMLREGEVDMAFSVIVDGETGWVDSEPITEFKLCAVMRDTHPLSNAAELSFDDLKNQSFILPEISMSDDNAVYHYLCKDAKNLNVRATINDSCALLQLLKYTNCVSVLSEKSVQNIEELRAVPIKEMSKPFVMYVHFLKNAYRKRSSTVFLDLLREVIAKNKMLNF